MKRHPILFTGPMVQAILDGTKTQTRRLHDRYKVGDVLWVRETWTQEGYGEPEPEDTNALRYRADISNPDAWLGHWKPSIHMPAWASRIDLEVTEVRAQRLQEISEEDILSEGAVATWWNCIGVGRSPVSAFDGEKYASLKAVWRAGWNSLNRKPGTRWEDNPMVWAYTFRRVK